MPELPEVETMRRGIASVAGCTIRDCRRPRSRLQSIEITPDFRSLRRRVVGRKIAGQSGGSANGLCSNSIRATASSSSRGCRGR